MEENVVAQRCERGNDLIAFLYGEVDDDEARDLERHMHGCAACKSEFSAFQGIRESIVSWRQKSLGTISSPATVVQTLVAPESARSLGPWKPSAVAAIREFFALSPLWLKGAVVFGSLLFCLFAALAVARLNQKPSPSVAVAPDVTAHSDRELQAMIEQRAQTRLEELKAMQTHETPVAPNETLRPQTGRRVTGGSSEFVYNPTPKTRLPLTRAERQQLAADLRLVSPNDDSDLDLLGDTLDRQN